MFPLADTIFVPSGLNCAELTTQLCPTSWWMVGEIATRCGMQSFWCGASATCTSLWCKGPVTQKLAANVDRAYVGFVSKCGAQNVPIPHRKCCTSCNSPCNQLCIPFHASLSTSARSFASNGSNSGSSSLLRPCSACLSSHKVVKARACHGEYV